MKRIYLAIAKWAANKAGVVLLHGDGCDVCQQTRGRHDRYHILAWRHISCAQPTVEALPSSLAKWMEKGRI